MPKKNMSVREFRNTNGELVGSFILGDAIQVLKATPDNSIDLIITDPAYSGMNQHLSLGKGRIVGAYSDSTNPKWFKEFHDDPENYRIFLKECFRVMKPDRHIFVMFDSFSLLTLGPVIREVFQVKNILTWDKVNIGMGHYFRRQSEFIVFASKGKRHLSSKSIPDVWRIKRIHNASYPTQKPSELFEAMIASSYLGEDKFHVLDPFAGSGSAAVAAIRQNVRFTVSDVSPESAVTIEQRLTSFLATGDDPLQTKSALVDGGLRLFWPDGS